MIKKKISILLTTILISCFVSSQEKEYSFSADEAVEYALKNGFEIQKINIDIEISKKKMLETMSIGFPKINAELNYSNNLIQPVSLIPAEFFGGKEGEFAEVQFGTKQNINGVIKLNQLVFDASYLIGLKSIQTYMDIFKFQKEREIELKRVTVLKSYGNLVILKDLIGVLEESEISSKKILDDTTQLFENGFVEKQTVIQLQINLTNLKNQIKQNRLTLRVLKNSFKIMLGLNYEDEIVLTDVFEDIGIGQFTNNLDEVFNNLNLKNNIDYKLAETDSEGKRLLYVYEKSKYYPSISAFINFNENAFSNEFTFFNSDQNWLESSTFGVKLAIPIFSGFNKKALVQQAKLEYKKSQVGLVELENQLKVRVENLYSQWAKSIQEFGNSKQTMDLSMEILNKEEEKLMNGISGSFDISQSQTQYYNSQIKYYNSLMNLISSSMDFEFAIYNTK